MDTIGDSICTCPENLKKIKYSFIISSANHLIPKNHTHHLFLIPFAKVSQDSQKKRIFLDQAKSRVFSLK